MSSHSFAQPAMKLLRSGDIDIALGRWDVIGARTLDPTAVDVPALIDDRTDGAGVDVQGSICYTRNGRRYPSRTERVLRYCANRADQHNRECGDTDPGGADAAFATERSALPCGPALKHWCRATRSRVVNYASLYPLPRFTFGIAQAHLYKHSEVVTMVLDLPPTVGVSPQPTDTSQQFRGGQSANGPAGRRVLDGAFTVLETLSYAHHGLGLTELANASGLAKTSAYRLAEQLVAVHAVQRVGGRYFIGPVIGRLGQCWQPDPLLRWICEQPIRRLSVLTAATAVVYVLQQRQARLVTAAAPVGQSWIPYGEFDVETTPHTAVGRVLLAADPHAARPKAIPRPKWALWRAGIRDQRFAVTESDRAPAGCCCAAAPIWRADGECAGAVAVLPRAPQLSRRIVDLLLHTTQRIDEALRSQQVRHAS